LWDEPHPHARMLMMFNNMSKVKHTNKGCYTSCIFCVWVWNSSHLNFISKNFDQRFFLIPFLPCMWVVQNINIHRSVVLSPKTFRTSRWMPGST
jgi:hypothetical protein